MKLLFGGRYSPLAVPQPSQPIAMSVPRLAGQRGCTTHTSSLNSVDVQVQEGVEGVRSHPLEEIFCLHVTA